ncbi:BTAD domain-containing putative transcriptional regulator [Streptomyces sp. NPDC047028]|uniref:AfsR/SARP family transcriptional regulator n=1 Tax=Streptomyces sp. NPDC047028 TaxID=3155793 RepID=UPI00340BCCA6
MSQNIRFSVLGQLRAMREEENLRLGSPQQQAMLTALLLRSGRPASIVELIDAVWGEDPPASASATIRTYAWRLRQSFAEPRSQPRTLVSVGDGYQLVVLPQDVDALWAECLTVQAARHRASGRLTDADECIGQALALWRGEPLIGVPGPYAEQQRGRLEELRLTLLEEHFDVMLRQGGYLLAVSELGALTRTHPLREPFHALYMRALRAAGRPADALAAYHRLREHLVGELGVEPSHELRHLFQELLSDDGSAGPSEEPDRPRPVRVERAARHRAADPEAGSAPPVEEPPPGAPDVDGASVSARPQEDGGRPALREPGAPSSPPDPIGGDPAGVLPVPAQLPPFPADFTGRAEVLDQLAEALVPQDADGPVVVVVTGMGGVGKTTLAVRAAHAVRTSFADGQLYADMRGGQPTPTDPGVVLAGFLTALGVAERFVPDSPDERAALLRSLLSGRRALIVLDNVSDTAQISSLLPGSDGCAVLVTTRSKLWSLPASARLTLPGFDTDEAIALLERIAGPERIAEDRPAARELVRRCGLLPLAVRIVASRLASRPAWQTASLSARLADESLRLSALRVEDLTVAAVFEMGYRQLTEAQARAFRLLAAVCEPDIGLPAACAVLELGEGEAEERLESLVDVSLVETRRPGRYRLHDLLRVFGRQQATAAERLGALARLLDFLLATAARAFQRAVPGDAVAATLSPSRSAGLSFDDVRAARAWVAAESEGVFSAVHAAARECVGSSAHEGSGVPAPAGTADSGVLLRAAVDLLIALTAFGPYLQREQLVKAAMAVAEAAQAHGDRQTAGRAHFLCGNFAVHSTRFALAKHHLGIAEASCRRTGDTAILCQTLNDTGLVALLEHRYDDALERLDESAALSRELGQQSGELVTTVNAALARLHSGRVEEAVEACERALTELRATADHQGVAYALSVLGLCMHRMGRYDDAVDRYLECVGMCRTLELRTREAQAQYRLAETLRAMDRLPDALTAAEQAVARLGDERAERDRAHALVALARTLCDLGRTEEAVPRLQEAATVFAELGLPDGAQVAALLRELGDRRPGTVAP